MPFEIHGKLGIDGSGFTQGLLRAQQEAAGFGNKVLGSFQGIGKNIGAQVTSSIAAAFSVGTVTRFFDSIMERIDRIQDLSEQFSVTTDEVQQMEHLADAGGLKFSHFGKALDRLNETRASALDGNEKLIKSFERFGVSMEELRNPMQRNIDLLKRIGETIKALGTDGMDKAALTDLLGGAGGRLAASLPGLADGWFVGISRDDINQVVKLQSEMKLARNQAQVYGARGLGGVLSRFVSNPLEATSALFTNPGAFFGSSGLFKTNTPDAVGAMNDAAKAEFEANQKRKADEQLKAAQLALDKALYKIAFDKLSVKEKEAQLEREISDLKEQGAGGNSPEALNALREAAEKQAVLDGLRLSTGNAAALISGGNSPKFITDSLARIGGLTTGAGLNDSLSDPGVRYQEQTVSELKGLREDVRDSRHRTTAWP